MPECNGDDKVVGQSLAGVALISVDGVELDRKGDDIEVDLIHHFVGVMMGVMDMGVADVLLADTDPPWRETLLKSSNNEQANTITKIDITTNP